MSLQRRCAGLVVLALAGALAAPVRALELPGHSDFGRPADGMQEQRS